METEGIAVLTELLSNNQKLTAMICTRRFVEDSILYKWPTLHEPSIYKPTWMRLISILQFHEKESLAEEIKCYLMKMEGMMLPCNALLMAIVVDFHFTHEWKH